jgi:hypothetical protein
MEKEYHGDANDPQTLRFLPSYGTELDDKLQKLGFRVDYTAAGFSRDGIVNTELFIALVQLIEFQPSSAMIS